MTSDQQNQMVSAHNMYRAQEQAANVQQCAWNTELASLAQTWASNCIWQHGMLKDCNGNSIGQNMYITCGSTPPPLNVTDVCSSWQSERTNWNFSSQNCAPNEVCGHWTQLVNYDSDQIGCGYANCPSVAVSGTTWTNACIVVCNYSPPGNQDGQLMYQAGNPCSNCDSAQTGAGYHCSTATSNLCEQCFPVNDTSCKCGTPPTCTTGTWDPTYCQCH